MKNVSSAGAFLWDDGTFAFVKKNLKKNSTSLDLTTDRVTKEVVDYIAKYITSPKFSLNDISFVQTRMQVETTSSLLQLIPSSHLKKLTINGNLLTLDLCNNLAEALKQDPCLEYLSVEYCDIWSKGMISIAGALPFNKNLRVLLAGGNSIFNDGAIALAQVLPQSQLETLSIAENEIWEDGTSAILANLPASHIVNLDISGNIVPLQTLSTAILNTKTLKAISLTGCKVDETKILDFLNSIADSELSTIILEGLNTNYLPIAWPRISDHLFENPYYFDLLVGSLSLSATINDLRLGFLYLWQIEKLSKSIHHDMLLSLTDFGRTGNCWVISLPQLSVEGPCKLFEWNTPLSNENASMLSTIFQNATFNENSITRIKLSGCEINDDVFKAFLENIDFEIIKMLDFSNNKITAASIEVLIKFLQKTFIKNLVLDTPIGEEGINQFIVFLKKNPSRSPVSLSIQSISAEKTGVATPHKWVSQLAEFLALESPLENLIISGDISVHDLVQVVQALGSNASLKHLTIKSNLDEFFRKIDSELGPDLLEQIPALIDGLLNALTDEDSKCKLQEITAELLSEVFLFTDEEKTKWAQIEAALEKNRLEK